MALPPTIPTSFVPKQPVAPTARKRSSGPNPFLALSYIILFITLLGAGGVFGYQFYLQDVSKRKAAALTTAENNIDQATVTEFIRLRDRFTTAKELLNHHIVLSQFFDVLEGITLQNVRFSSLKITADGSHTPNIEMAGTAKNFNALAAQSTAFAQEKRIKRAIFSGISLNGKDNTVSFSLKADLEPVLVYQGATGDVLTTGQPVPSLPTAPATTTPTVGTTTKP